MASDRNGATAMAGGQCPVCKASRDAHYKPFCSKRCADVDLARWLTGSYAIAGGQADSDEDGDDTLASRRLPIEPKGNDNEDE